LSSLLVFVAVIVLDPPIFEDIDDFTRLLLFVEASEGAIPCVDGRLSDDIAAAVVDIICFVIVDPSFSVFLFVVAGLVTILVDAGSGGLPVDVSLDRLIVPALLSTDEVISAFLLFVLIIDPPTVPVPIFLLTRDTLVLLLELRFEVAVVTVVAVVVTVFIFFLPAVAAFVFAALVGVSSSIQFDIFRLNKVAKPLAIFCKSDLPAASCSFSTASTLFNNILPMDVVVGYSSDNYNIMSIIVKTIIVSNIEKYLL
jgi:hypothetical protein